MERGYREEKKEERQRGTERWTGATGKRRIIDLAG